MSESKKRTDKRIRILQGAREVFARFGYDKTTLEDIGKRCGLNKASLYYYFKNKEEIFARVVVEEAAAFMSELQAATRREATTQARMRFYLSERLRYYGEVVTLHQLSIESLEKVEPLFERLYEFVKAKELQFIAQLLEEGMEAGEFDLEEIDELAESLFLISDAFRHEAIRQTRGGWAEEVDYDELAAKVELVIQLIFKGLQNRK